MLAELGHDSLAGRLDDFHELAVRHFPVDVAGDSLIDVDAVDFRVAAAYHVDLETALHFGLHHIAGYILHCRLARIATRAGRDFREKRLGTFLRALR